MKQLNLQNIDKTIEENQIKTFNKQSKLYFISHRWLKIEIKEVVGRVDDREQESAGGWGGNLEEKKI